MAASARLSWDTAAFPTSWLLWSSVLAVLLSAELGSSSCPKMNVRTPDCSPHSGWFRPFNLDSVPICKACRWSRVIWAGVSYKRPYLLASSLRASPLIQKSPPIIYEPIYWLLVCSSKDWIRLQCAMCSVAANELGDGNVLYDDDYYSNMREDQWV